MGLTSVHHTFECESLKLTLKEMSPGYLSAVGLYEFLPPPFYLYF